MYLDDLAVEVHTNSIAHGFYPGELTDETILAKLALIHSEVTELLEAVRKDKGEFAIEDEFADIIIRTADLWQAMKDDSWFTGNFETVVLRKVRVNGYRPYRHGHNCGV